MAQYRVGTVSINNGSAYVSGAGTLWQSTGITSGYLFALQGTDGWYYIANVQSNTALTLTAPYTGATASAETYVIIRDYLDPQHIPLMHRGDANWPSIFNEAMLRIQTALTGGSISPSGSGTGLDGAYDIDNTIFADSAPVIIYRSGTYGGADRAPALHISDQNTIGVSNSLAPFEGALEYIYSRHRTPLIAVTNYADRGDAGSPSSYANAAIFGVATADDPTEFQDSYPWLRNVGIAGMSIDYHSTYGASSSSDVGVWAYSQKGYGLVASSNNSYAAYISQPSGAPGMYVKAPSNVGVTVDSYRPLHVSSAAYATASNQFAIQLDARRGGLNVISNNATTVEYPGIKVSASGITIRSIGKALMEATQTALEVSGGAVSYPAAVIRSNRVGLEVTGTSSWALRASSTTHPAIDSKDGITIFSDNHALISSPQRGTIVYSNAASGLRYYDGSTWQSIGAGGAGSVSLQDAYDVGSYITIASEGLYPVDILSYNNLAFQAKNLNTTQARDASFFYSSRGWAISASSDVLNTNYGAIQANAVRGIGLKVSTQLGQLIKGTATGTGTSYAASLQCGAGGGLEVTTTTGPDVAYATLSLGSSNLNLIKARSATGKLIDFQSSSGVATGDGYAISLACGTGAGIKVGTSGYTGNALRLESLAPSGTMLYMSSANTTGIQMYGMKKGIHVRTSTDYAIIGERADGPAIRSQYGITASTMTLGQVLNPIGGTIVYQALDARCYYYSDAVNGWLPLAIASGANMPFTLGGDRGNNILIKGQWPETQNIASFLAPFSGYITKARMAVDIPPSGASLMVDINKNSASIFTFAGTQLEIKEGEYSSNTITLTGEDVTQYDDINIDIDQAGTITTGGEDLRIIIYFGISDTYVMPACSGDYCTEKVDIPTISSFTKETGPYGETIYGTIQGSGFGVYCGSAKVEIGNNALYALCTILHEQEITYWTDSQIRFGANTMGLGEGTGSPQLWYIYVTDGCGTRTSSDGPY